MLENKTVTYTIYLFYSGRPVDQLLKAGAPGAANITPPPSARKLSYIIHWAILLDNVPSVRGWLLCILWPHAGCCQSQYDCVWPAFPSIAFHNSQWRRLVRRHWTFLDKKGKILLLYCDIKSLSKENIFLLYLPFYNNLSYFGTIWFGYAQL